MKKAGVKGMAAMLVAASLMSTAAPAFACDSIGEEFIEGVCI